MTDGAHRSVVRFETQQGIVLDVHPLTSVTRMMIKQKLDRDYPEPVPPRVPAGDAGANSGVMVTDREDPEYLLARARWAQSFNLRLMFAQIAASCTPAEQTRDELIEYYADYLAQVGEYVELSGKPWQDTLVHAILNNDDDRNLIVEIIGEKAELTEEGVADKVRIFRPVRSRGED